MAPRWKVLIYMAAEGSLYEAAEKNQREICRATAACDLQISVHVDGPSPELAFDYAFSQGEKHTTWEAPDGYTRDRRRRLEDFLLRSAKDIKDSDDTRICVILWGHGAGLDHFYVYGDSSTLSGTPETPDQDNSDVESEEAAPEVRRGGGRVEFLLEHFTEILNSEFANHYVSDVGLGEALRAFTNPVGRKIDILGLDACLMSMAEVAYQVSDSVSLLVASSEMIAGTSWPYEVILKDLGADPGMSPKSFACKIVDRFVAHYPKGSDGCPSTLAAIDLEQSGTLISAMTELAGALLEVSNAPLKRRRILRSRATAVGHTESDYIDLQLFCSELVDSFESDSDVGKHAAVLDLLINHHYVVCYHSAPEERPDKCGLCLYFPAEIPPSGQELDDALTRMGLFRFNPSDPSSSDVPNKFPPYSNKFPPYSNKFPPYSRKFPPYSRKHVGISCYAILWDSYVDLDFCRLTKWDRFLRVFLNYDGAGQYPKAENADQK